MPEIGPIIAMTERFVRGAVTYAKVQNVTASRLLGNATGAPAAPAEISLGANLTFNGAAVDVGDALLVLTGQTSSPGSGAGTLTNAHSAGNPTVMAAGLDQRVDGLRRGLAVRVVGGRGVRRPMRILILAALLGALLLSPQAYAFLLFGAGGGGPPRRRAAV